MSNKNESKLTAHPDTGTTRKSVLNWNRKDISDKISLPTSINKYITKDYSALDTAMSDINNDNINDFLLIICNTKEDSLRFETKKLKRELLLFLGQNDGSYKLVFRNANAIPCINCCGMADPFGGISLTRGQISILRYCASNCKSISKYNFRYSSMQKNWYLDNVINESYCFNYEDYSCDTSIVNNFRKVWINTFNIENDYEQ